MSVSMLDNFNIRKSAPNVERDMFQTIADMKAYNENYLPQVFIATCVEDGCLYIFNKSNEVNLVTGKWRKFEGGSSGSSQKEVLPTASATEVGNIYQFIGATGTYTKGYFYICSEVVDSDTGDTSYAWVNIPVQDGGEGSGVLENQLNATVSVGGVSSGTSYTVGTSLETILTDILNPLAYPTLVDPSCVLTTSASKIIEKGSTATVTLVATFDRGSITPAYGTSGYRSGTATSYALNGGTEQADRNFEDVTVDEDHDSFVVAVAYSAGEQPLDSKGNDYSTALAAGGVTSPALTFEFVDAWWANDTNAGTITKQGLISKTVKQKIIEFPATTETNPEVFDIPTGWTVTAVEVYNDLSNKWDNCASEFTKTTTTHLNTAGDTVTYNRYTCNLPYNMAARTIRIKWS